jgi:hypothetical protein
MNAGVDQLVVDPLRFVVCNLQYEDGHCRSQQLDFSGSAGRLVRTGSSASIVGVLVS